MKCVLSRWSLLKVHVHVLTYIFIVNVLSAVIPIYLDGSFLMSPAYISLNMAKGHFLYFLYFSKLEIYQVFKNYNNKIVQHHCRYVYLFFHPFHVMYERAKCHTGAEKVDANARLSTDEVLFRITTGSGKHNRHWHVNVTSVYHTVNLFNLIQLWIWTTDCIIYESESEILYWSA